MSKWVAGLAKSLWQEGPAGKLGAVLLVVLASLAIGLLRHGVSHSAQLARESNLTFLRSSFEPVSDRDRTLTRLKIEMSLSGNYADMRRFLHALETAFARLQESHRHSQWQQRLDKLTPREHDVYQAIVQGLSHREAGEQLNISPRTVEVHKARIMDKLGVTTLAELLRQALASNPRE